MFTHRVNLQLNPDSLTGISRKIQIEYKGFVDDELRANDVRLKNDVNNERLPVRQAIAMASLLRREAGVTYQTTFWQ